MHARARTGACCTSWRPAAPPRGELLQDQAAELCFVYPGHATEPRALLGKRLAEVTPGNLKKTFFTLGGAEANENAIKFARFYTGRHKILARYRSYHGATAGAMALTGDPRRFAWEPLTMAGVVHFLDPYRYRSTFRRTNLDIPEAEFTLDYLNHLAEIIRYEGPETIAAVLIETVTGTNGIISPPEGYLQGVRSLCDNRLPGRGLRQRPKAALAREEERNGIVNIQ